MGSNQGDRPALLRRAVALLGAAAGIEVRQCSRVFETDPVGPLPQGDYLNAVLRLETTLPARVLLDRLLEIEPRCGRHRDRGTARWGPRTLDLDLLLYADRCIAEPFLEVPHPRLHERAFVLEPLCDLVPEHRHPRLGVSFRELAAAVRAPGAVRVTDLELLVNPTSG